MNLCDDICCFLTGKGVDCRLDDNGGQKVLYTGSSAAVIPVCVHAHSIKEASEQAERLKQSINLHMDKTGEYPLVITEDRWLSQKSMMQARLLAHLRIFTPIYARNCEIRKIDKLTAANFLNANHSYGDARCRYRYGLYLKRHTGHNSGSTEVTPGTLVAVAAFSNARRWIKADKIIRSYEWTRYASLPDVRLSGGMGKLLNAFIEDVHPDDIMTYADLEWSEGRVYEALGFVLEGFKEPVCFNVNASWRRSPVKPGMTETVKPGMTETVKKETPEAVKTGTSEVDGIAGSTDNLFFKNLGSNKYRLKLTDYQ